jgi:hypothetical protein
VIFGDWNKYPSHWANRVNDTIQRKAILLADILGLPGEPPLGKVVRSQVEFVEFVGFVEWGRGRSEESGIGLQ